MTFPGPWKWPNNCGWGNTDQFGCRPIGTDGHLKWNAFLGPTALDSAVFQGDFTSDTAASGVWSVRRGGCTDSGTWSAKFLGDASMSCSQADAFEVCAWVDDPTPTGDVQVYGQLLEQGLAVSADSLPMSVSWRLGSETKTRCEPFSEIGRGLAGCIAYITQVEPGQTIPVEVTIEYKGQTYTTSTSFTRK
jgi:hypothetical protein